MITIIATPEEVAALKQLLHRAVQHSGLDAAEAAVFWMRKIQAAENKTSQRPTETQNEQEIR